MRFILMLTPLWLRRWLGMPTDGEQSAETVARRRVMTVAWPVVVEGLLQTTIGVIDTFLVASVGDAAVAGVGTALQAIFIVIVVVMAISVGCSVLVAQATGADDERAVRTIARQSLSLTVIMAVPLAVLSVAFSEPLLGLFGAEPDVTAVAVDYWNVTSYTLPVMMVMFVAAAILRGTGDTRTPMRATLLANIINGVLAWLLISGRLGFPELGASGSAWAAALGRAAAVGWMLWIMFAASGRLRLRGRAGWRPRWKTVRGVVGIGTPTAIEEFFFAISFAVLTAIVAVLGTEALAAHRIAITALTLAFLPGFGFAVAATTLVGQAYGARDPDTGASSTRIAAQYAAAWMGAIGLLYFVFATPIMDAFSDDPVVISTGASALMALAISQPFWGLMMVYAGALRGTGNTRFPLVVNTLSNWAAVILGWIAVAWLDLGLGATWLTYSIVTPPTIAAFWWRIRRDRFLGNPTRENPTPQPPPQRGEGELLAIDP